MKHSVKKLLYWYQQNGRKLPWRSTQDPYKIWISEIILQQTRVNQGLPYFERFIEQFPTVFHLGAAPQDSVLKYWEGLGYYSRARNLHHAAKELVNLHQGKFPEKSAELMKLKGIGPYTSRAIASLAFGEKVAVVDGNVFRILSRLYADDTCIDLPKAKTHFQTLADNLLGKANPADFNQAMMDLGALICLPTQANCPACPFQQTCQAYAQQSVQDFPVRKAKTAKPVRTAICYLTQTPSGKFWIRQRADSGLWGGLYEFPWFEPGESFPEFIRHIEWTPLGTVRHVFTHFILELQVLFATLPEKNFPTGSMLKNSKSIDYLAFPKAMHKVQDLFRNK
jgi:A/G-specific adenine glycosylase